MVCRLGTELAYLAIGGGVGVIAFGVHLLVAERRGTALALAGVRIIDQFGLIDRIVDTPDTPETLSRGMTQ